MPISPVGNVIYTNQNTPVASQVQQNQQQRIDFQNSLAAEFHKDEKDKIQETNPVEENHKIDPDREHQKHEKDDEEREETDLKGQKKKEIDPEPEPNRTRLLDIKG